MKRRPTHYIADVERSVILKSGISSTSHGYRRGSGMRFPSLYLSQHAEHYIIEIVRSCDSFPDCSSSFEPLTGTAIYAGNGRLERGNVLRLFIYAQLL